MPGTVIALEAVTPGKTEENPQDSGRLSCKTRTDTVFAGADCRFDVIELMMGRLRILRMRFKI